MKIAVPTPTVRMRRLRQHPVIRDLVRETQLSSNDLIYPLFIKHDIEENISIHSMPGQYQLGIKQLSNEVKSIQDAGVQAVMLFGIPKYKDAKGSNSWQQEGIIQQAIHTIKQTAPELLVITDTCFCEYTDHGHCGAINEKTGKLDVDNDETLALLVRQALSQVEAGADVIAPSGMIDGMIQALRHSLDHYDYQHIPILSYSVKYNSKLYGPFREAAEGAPKLGDRRTYQMDPANSNEALREAELDIAEGADMLMVKPAIAYLDIIYRIKQTYPALPLCAYQVSGEYATIKAAAKEGWLDEKDMVLESLIAIKRAGADFIITYFAKQVTGWLK